MARGSRDLLGSYVSMTALMETDDRRGSGTVLHFAAMSDGSMTNTGPSCPNGGCAPLSRHSVDLLQRRHSCGFNRSMQQFGGIVRQVFRSLVSFLGAHSISLPLR